MRTSLKWLGIILAIGLISLAASAKTYLASVNRQEVTVAQNQPEGVVQPVTLNINPYSLGGFTGTGKMKIYTVNWGFKFIISGAHSGTYTLPGAGLMAETDFAVQPGEVVTILMQYTGGIHKPYAWVSLTDPAAGRCGVDTAPIVAQATARGESVVSVQCWNDDEDGVDAFDDLFDDFEVVITQVTGNSPVVSPSPGAGTACVATAPTGLTVTQGASNDQAIMSWYQGVRGSQQLIKIGPNQAEVLSGCQSNPTSCVYTATSPVYTTPADPTQAQQMWFFTTGAAFNQPVHTCIQTAGEVGSPGYTSIARCENNLKGTADFGGWAGKTSGVCYLSKDVCDQNSLGSLTLNGLTPGQTYYYRVVNYVSDTCRPDMVVSFTQAGTVSPSPVASASPAASPNPSASPGSGGNAASPSPSVSGSSGNGSQPDTGTPTWLTAGALLTGLGLLTIKLLLKI